MLDEKQLGL
jgi:uncharacterized protein with HEPN domain